MLSQQAALPSEFTVTSLSFKAFMRVSCGGASDPVVSPFASEAWGSNPGDSLPVRSWHILPILTWVFSRYLRFLPHSKNKLLKPATQQAPRPNSPNYSAKYSATLTRINFI